MNSLLFKALLVFIIVLLADTFWTLYLLNVEKRRAVRAAFWSSMIVICGFLSTIFYVEEHLMVIPAILGSFVGTFLVVHKAKANINDR